MGYFSILFIEKCLRQFMFGGYILLMVYDTYPSKIRQHNTQEPLQEQSVVDGYSDTLGTTINEDVQDDTDQVSPGKDI
jgi:hypothetical protein